MHVEDPYIVTNTLQEREYQRNLADACLRSSTLVVLPTGLGKTVVALWVIADVLANKNGKVLMLAPTKPLVEQHASFLSRHLVGKRIAMMTGELRPVDRPAVWQRSEVVVSTPQVIVNDLKDGRLDLGEVELIVFDEAHRATGDYAYVPIAEAYQQLGGRVMGMTASPGGSKARIYEVCGNLGIERVEVRSEEDPDVAPYVHDIHIDWVEVDVPDKTKEVASLLKGLHESYIRQLVSMGMMTSKRPPTITYLLEVNKTLQARLHKAKNKGYIFRALSLQAMAIKVAHALELVETQGFTALSLYLEKLEREAGSKSGSKASRAIVGSPVFGKVKALLSDQEEEHPKVPELINRVTEQITHNATSRVLVFTNYRDSCEMVVKLLSSIKGARVGRLVGQTDRYGDQGLDQKEQVEMLSRFRAGEINVLVATCVGEEGLDVANTDLVIFYEPVPSEIRSIQRRGRTGRNRPGRIVVLVTKETRDEASLNISIKKEMVMMDQLLKFRKRQEKSDKARGRVKATQ